MRKNIDLDIKGRLCLIGWLIGWDSFVDTFFLDIFGGFLITPLHS